MCKHYWLVLGHDKSERQVSQVQIRFFSVHQHTSDICMEKKNGETDVQMSAQNRALNWALDCFNTITSSVTQVPAPVVAISDKTNKRR